MSFNFPTSDEIDEGFSFGRQWDNAAYHEINP